jgi:ankyrin repeat protein
MKLGGLFFAGWLCLAAETDLLTTIRGGDMDALKHALQAGADANTADARGNTALHYAALYSSPEAMALLIQAGARVNAANQAGAPPLLTAIGDLAKVRLLVEKGADVNAGSALRNAANLWSGAPVVEFLLAKGAKPDPATLGAAIRRKHMELVTRWLAAGVLPNPNHATSAANGAHPKLLQAVLTKTESATSQALMIAAYFGPAENVRMLLEHPVEINAKDNRGRTALMRAAGSDHSDVSVIKLLLEKGAADPSLKDGRGDTALDFARARRDDAKIRALGGEPVAPVPVRFPDSLPPVRVAVERALKLLDSAGPAFFKKNACISCHNQSIPQMASAEIGVESPHAKAVLSTWRGHMNEMWETSCRVGGGEIATLTYGLAGLGAAKEPANPAIDLAVNCLAKLQAPDGSWPLTDERQPLGMNTVKYTALGMRGLQLYPLPGLKTEFAHRIARARAFLEATPPTQDTQSLAFQVIGMKWAASDPAKIRAAASRLLAAQRADGGWSQKPAMESDAFATAQAVWALWAGAGVSRDDAAWQRGVRYLRATQKEDGSWHVRSRGFGFQPYRETGFPYGHDQWISSAATGFAVMALAPLVVPGR